MVTLDKTSHVYTEIVDGFPVVVDSLSTVLKLGGLGTDYSFIDPDVLARKAMIGNAMHSCIELYLKGELDEHSIDEQVLPYWNSFSMCLDQLPPLDGGIAEQPVGGVQLGYACTPDWVAPDGRAIIEWKTTSRLYKSVWPQLAGQALALKLPEAERYVVVFRPYGKPIVKKAKQPWIHDQAFKSAFNIYQWNQFTDKEAA